MRKVHFPPFRGRMPPAVQTPWSAEWELQKGTRVKLATRARAAELLRQEDDYTAQLTPFDLTAKLQADRPGSRQDYLEHAALQAQDFSPAEMVGMERNVALVGAALERLEMVLPLPEVVEVVRSGLREEGGMAGYTRRHFIVLGPRALDARTFAHELFHVFSRHSAATRKALYGLFEVELIPPIPVPEPLAERVITNPDAPLLDTRFRGRRGDHEVDLTMVPMAREAYRGGPLGPYVLPRLLELEKDGENWKPRLEGENPVVHERSAIQGLKEKLGDNTSYDIHPEEVSAEHFVLMLAGKGDIPHPDLVEGMYQVLKKAAPGG